ncbi:LacI family DNA-binding transcriptional regulator [Dictyobacter arantiisoli]|uniref:LacI family transcriptional regulator n=1 Tax=Dictyobacter arantiisoli TaxID=2014874 RepID=A0A5A5TKD3_9CHLR|nr:LacI family DNA-binding transcriptional regulator [Dictyobacter arantiisoli]GCF11499.1 LacI family transcriptional regulator [Dictyobacter arantiisoli]
MATPLPSIVAVAKKAGVSVATASRVMSSSTYPVSEATREKVLQAAQELHYTPNSLARSLKAQHSKLLAVLVGDNADPYFAQVARGVEEIANEHGYLTIMCNTERDPIRERTYLNTLQDYRADGIIITGSGYNHTDYTDDLNAIVQKIQQRGGAVVTLSPHVIQAPSIQTDNVGGAREITAYLLSLGHRSIAFVSGPEDVTVSDQRQQGYQQAMEAAGIAIHPTWLIQGDFTQSGGERAAYQLTQLAERPSAVFACNDETAFGLMNGLQQQGWRIPQDISLCGFGDLPMAKMVVPSLTTVHIALRELGQKGAQKILALLKEPQEPTEEILPNTIIKRNSTIPFTEH